MQEKAAKKAKALDEKCKAKPLDSECAPWYSQNAGYVLVDNNWHPGPVPQGSSLPETAPPGSPYGMQPSPSMGDSPKEPPYVSSLSPQAALAQARMVANSQH